LPRTVRVVERDAGGASSWHVPASARVAAILADMRIDGAMSPEREDPPLISLRGLPGQAALSVASCIGQGSRSAKI